MSVVVVIVTVSVALLFLVIVYVSVHYSQTDKKLQSRARCRYKESRREYHIVFNRNDNNLDTISTILNIRASKYLYLNGLHVYIQLGETFRYQTN